MDAKEYIERFTADMKKVITESRENDTSEEMTKFLKKYVTELSSLPEEESID